MVTKEGFNLALQTKKWLIDGSSSNPVTVQKIGLGNQWYQASPEIVKYNVKYWGNTPALKHNFNETHPNGQTVVYFLLLNAY